MKLNAFSDPTCRTYDGVDRVKWVPFEASTVFARRGGKAVGFHVRYRAAVSDASNLAGFAEVDAVGATGDHPASVSDGNLLPVNMGLGKTCVFPTSNRAAVLTDIGKSFNLVVNSDVQSVNLTTTAQGVLTVTKILDEAGSYVAVKIPESKLHGNI